jgi:hypothetical protein
MKQSFSLLLPILLLIGCSADRRVDDLSDTEATAQRDRAAYQVHAADLESQRSFMLMTLSSRIH